MTTNTVINAIVTLLVTIDPVSLAPLFLAITNDMSKQQRISVALRGSFLAFIILLIFALAGNQILLIFGITLDAFRVAGGLLLFFIAFEMIFSTRQNRKQNDTEKALSDDHVRSIAVFPIAIPLIAGPGAISASILLSPDFQNIPEKLMFIGIIASTIFFIFLVLILSERINAYIGDTARSLMTRLLGVLLSALAVQYVADGVKALILT